MSVIKAPLLIRKSPPTCLSCLLRAEVRSLQRSGRRSFGQKSVRSQEGAGHPVPATGQLQLGWSKRAADIKAGRKDSILGVLEKRGLVNQIVGQRDNLDRLLTEERVGVYLGIDPTAPSLHVGHLVPLMALYWMYSYGFPAFLIVGDFTAKFGDPSGRTTEREEQEDSELDENAARIKRQLELLWLGTDKELLRNEIFSEDIRRQRELTNNSSWLLKNVLDFFMGRRRQALGSMLGRSTLKTKIEKGEIVTWAAFDYPSLQAWDFWHLYSSKGVRIQIGGSDQFGNILSGLESIKFFRRKEVPEREPAEDELSKSPMGFTVPLLTTASGQKFGKSAGNALWLDPDLTSPFSLYQYFLKTSDDDVHQYLKFFTFESLQSLQELINEHMKAPHVRLAQHKLAFNVLRLVHGEEKAERARREHSIIFQSAQGFSTASIRQFAINGLQEDASVADSTSHPDESKNQKTFLSLPKSKIINRSIPQVLHDAGLVGSRSEGKRLCDSNGAYVGVRLSSEGTEAKWQPVSEMSEEDRINVGNLVIDGVLPLRVGKSKVTYIVVAEGEDVEQRGRG